MAKKKRVLDALLDDFEGLIESFGKNDYEEVKDDIEEPGFNSLEAQFEDWYQKGIRPSDFSGTYESTQPYRDYYINRISKKE